MIRKIAYSFTRPSDTTAYANADLVANSTTAGSVVPLSFNIGGSGGKLVHARLEKSDVSNVANATFSLHLFGTSPVATAPTNGDNGAITHIVAAKLGVIPFAIMVAGLDDSYTVLRLGDTSFLEPVYCAYPTIYGLLEAKAAYTPVSAEVFNCVLTFDK